MEEVVEQVISATDVVAGRTRKQELVYIAVVSTVAFGAGGGVAWLLSKRHYRAKYEEQIEFEIAEAKAFYAKLYKEDQFATPGEAAEALGARGVAASEALQRYQGKHPEPEVELKVSSETTEIEVKPVTNVFEERKSNDRWDQVEEEKKRETMDPDEPYILNQDEYMQGELEYVQKTLTYFAEDDVLVDEQEKPIELIDSVVGEENLTKFGHGSGDNRILYIRNDKISMDFEIVKNDGSYSKEVLGFEHADGPRVRKMRGGYE